MGEISQDIIAEIEAQKLLYSAGSKQSSIHDLIGICTKRNIHQVMDLLSDEIKNEMKKFVESPPKDCEKMIMFSSAIYNGEFYKGKSIEEIEEEIEQNKQKEKQQVFDSLWLVHHFFYG